MNDSKIYAEFKAANGEVQVEGKTYALIAQAELTNRVFYWSASQLTTP